MTGSQKESIRDMRLGGVGYTKIAKELGVSENTVKSYCRRNGLNGAGIASRGSGAESGGVPPCAGVPADYAPCDRCGLPVAQAAGRKHKRFCSDKCRMDWWNAHPEAVTHKTVHTVTCLYCGAEFEHYGGKPRKYCSRGCFALDRRDGRNLDEY